MPLYKKAMDTAGLFALQALAEAVPDMSRQCAGWIKRL
jgi:hypothetical protein